MDHCCKEGTVTFQTATPGYHAVYAVEKQPKLRNVVGWLTITCSTCQTWRVVAAVMGDYALEIVPADSFDAFVCLVGPNPQADQKASAERLMSEAAQNEHTRLAREQARKQSIKQLTRKASE